MNPGEKLIKQLRLIKKIAGPEARLERIKSEIIDRWGSNPPDNIRQRVDYIEAKMPMGHARETATEIRATLAEVESLLLIDDAIRGRGQLAGASDGGKERAKKHGFKHRAEELQREVNDLHCKNRHLSYAQIQERVAITFNCSASTVKNYTKNPNKTG